MGNSKIPLGLPGEKGRSAGWDLERWRSAVKGFGRRMAVLCRCEVQTDRSSTCQDATGDPSVFIAQKRWSEKGYIRWLRRRKEKVDFTPFVPQTFTPPPSWTDPRPRNRLEISHSFSRVSLNWACSQGGAQKLGERENDLRVGTLNVCGRR